ncbi:hypothetical protein EJ05DRAFT_326393 [Pseudovirgaria hyperparasitica]|uniref:Uncharacterized protein n=1 Tax=Pseudovirgaria hyperparasitica TaxID=470096 RepID=A0A6A6WBD8_9PEZI|nr:uncharacterized protein EJ05DRAFT_326393 [Pseudovirgaria hyperparasitica]KAF2758917.1 hypothetical protein EJ05DRAFT_326393 [Pseudovirgaria hyperparasitica]
MQDPLAITSQELVLTIPRNAEVTKAALKAALSKVKHYVCPHESDLTILVTHSLPHLNCIAGPLGTKCTRHDHSHADESSNKLSIPYHDCQRCQTAMRLFRWERSTSPYGGAKSPDEIILLVTRVIHHLADPATPFWLHHLEPSTYDLNRDLTECYTWCRKAGCATSQRRFAYLDVALWEERYKYEKSKLGLYPNLTLWHQRAQIAHRMRTRRRACMQGKPLPTPPHEYLRRWPGHYRRCWGMLGFEYRTKKRFEGWVDSISCSVLIHGSRR